MEPVKPASSEKTPIFGSHKGDTLRPRVLACGMFKYG